MVDAIIGGTGFYSLGEGGFSEEIIETAYGPARVYRGSGEQDNLCFVPRHGADHTVPPHRVNYRANMMALQILGVQRVLGIFTVGSLHTGISPRSLVLLDQFIDCTSGRDSTYFEGGDSGLAHVEMNRPYCDRLRGQLQSAAERLGIALIERGTYVATNGPRFETPAEIRMYAQWGGDVVGMTGVPEVTLARELGLHYAAVALSVNWGAGLEAKIEIVKDGIEGLRQNVLALFREALKGADEGRDDICECKTGMMLMHPPKN